MASDSESKEKDDSQAIESKENSASENMPDKNLNEVELSFNNPQSKRSLTNESKIPNVNEIDIKNNEQDQKQSDESEDIPLIETKTQEDEKEEATEPTIVKSSNKTKEVISAKENTDIFKENKAETNNNPMRKEPVMQKNELPLKKEEKKLQPLQTKPNIKENPEEINKNRKPENLVTEIKRSARTKLEKTTKAQTRKDPALFPIKKVPVDFKEEIQKAEMRKTGFKDKKLEQIKAPETKEVKIQQQPLKIIKGLLFYFMFLFISEVATNKSPAHQEKIEILQGVVSEKTFRKNISPKNILKPLTNMKTAGK